MVEHLLIKVGFMVCMGMLATSSRPGEAFCSGPGMGLYEFCHMLSWAIRGAPWRVISKANG